MIAQGFKPVGWVAAVAGAALGCYMLSLNVASERAELAKIERQIIAAKQEIRTLQTELGTRGRMQQLEHWNAEVLALSAPTAAQYLENPVTLARFETKDPTIEEKARVTMAAAEVKAPAPKAEIAAGRKLSPEDYAKVAERAAETAQPKVRFAAAELDGDAKIAAPVVKASAVKLPVDPKPGKSADKKKPAEATKQVEAKKPEKTKKAVEASKPAGKSDASMAARNVGAKAEDKPAKPARTADAKSVKAEPKPAKKPAAAKTGDGA